MLIDNERAATVTRSRCERSFGLQDVLKKDFRISVSVKALRVRNTSQSVDSFKITCGSTTLEYVASLSSLKCFSKELYCEFVHLGSRYCQSWPLVYASCFLSKSHGFDAHASLFAVVLSTFSEPRQSRFLSCW